MLFVPFPRVGSLGTEGLAIAYSVEYLSFRRDDLSSSITITVITVVL